MPEPRSAEHKTFAFEEGEESARKAGAVDVEEIFVFPAVVEYVREIYKKRK